MNSRAAGAIDPAAIAMLERVGGRQLLVKMISAFLEDAPRRLALARTCAAAGDATGVAQVCHALKSSAGQLGALHLQEACSRGEALTGAGQGGDLVVLVDQITGGFDIARRNLEALRDGTT